jgi:hypothetical protein
MDQNEGFPSDMLSQLQLRIARRADELVRESKIATPLNLHCWFAAESELGGAVAFTSVPHIGQITISSRPGQRGGGFGAFDCHTFI